MTDYKHYIRTDSEDVDDNGFEKIIHWYCTAFESFQAGDIELGLSERIDAATIMPRHCHLQDYVASFNNEKQHVRNTSTNVVQEYVETTAGYGELELAIISLKVQTKIYAGFEYDDGSGNSTYTLKDEDQRNLIGVKNKIDADSGYTSKWGSRKVSDSSREVKSLNSTKLDELYAAAFTFKDNLLQNYSQLKIDVWAAANKAAVGTLISDFETANGI